MNKLERIKEIIKASPDFGKRVGYKMCIVDELHDVKEQFEKESAELKDKLNNLSSVAAVRLANWQKYEKENAELKKGLSVVNASNSFNKEQLTKVKELLNEFMRISKASDEDFEHDYSELIAEAERFLKEE